jgi:hypothetical protein
MANVAKLTIRVSSARGSTTIAYSTNGRYVRLLTGDITNHMVGQPVLTGTGSKAFWAAAIALAAADIAAGNGGGT